MALKVLILAALCAGASAQFWPWPTTTAWPTTTVGYPPVPSYNGYSNNGDSGKNFDRRLSSAILDRLYRGRAVKVSVDESRKLSYEQVAECNTCNQPKQPNATTPLPPAPVLINYGNALIDVPCYFTYYSTLTSSLSFGSNYGYTWNSAIRGSSTGNFNNYLVGPDSNGYIYLNYQPSAEFSQVIEVWITDSNGQKSNSVFLTFDFHYCQLSTSTTQSSTTWTSSTPTTPSSYPYLYAYGNTVIDVPCYLGSGSYISTPGLSFSTNGVYWYAYSSYSTNGNYNNYISVVNGGQFYLQNQPNADFTQYVNVYVTDYNGYSSGYVQLTFNYHSCYSTTTDSTTTSGPWWTTTASEWWTTTAGV